MEQFKMHIELKKQIFNFRKCTGVICKYEVLMMGSIGSTDFVYVNCNSFKVYLHVFVKVVIMA